MSWLTIAAFMLGFLIAFVGMYIYSGHILTWKRFATSVPTKEELKKKGSLIILIGVIIMILTFIITYLTFPV